jgi:hypothetical protein
VTVRRLDEWPDFQPDVASLVQVRVAYTSSQLYVTPGEELHFRRGDQRVDGSWVVLGYEPYDYHDQAGVARRGQRLYLAPMPARN